MTFIECGFAVLGARIYRVIEDPDGQGQATMEDLMFVFHEQGDQMISEIVKMMLDQGVIVQNEPGIYEAAPPPSEIEQAVTSEELQPYFRKRLLDDPEGRQPIDEIMALAKADYERDHGRLAEGEVTRRKEENN